jgi:hypothetical protein
MLYRNMAIHKYTFKSVIKYFNLGSPSESRDGFRYPIACFSSTHEYGIKKYLPIFEAVTHNLAHFL